MESETAEQEYPRVELFIPEPFVDLYQPKRYKVYWGGRGSAKSWSFAQALITQAHHERHLILCTREYQNSIADSVHRTIVGQINRMGLQQWFNVTQTGIKSRVTGSEFIFKGLHHNVQEIKSLEGVSRCWVEEAQSATEDSWVTLEPTIREKGSEIWVSFNPVYAIDPTYRRFVIKPPPPEMAIIRKVGWQDNPWFEGTELDTQRKWCLNYDPDRYDWVWEGHTRKISNATVFRDRFEVRAFETPEHVDMFYLGADWGFAQDPACLIRSFVIDNVLYIDYEAYAVGVETDELGAVFCGGRSSKTGTVYPGVPGARDWPCIADSARPDTISYVRRHAAMNILPSEKGKGSVEDGIAYLKSFNKIVIHERCVNTAQEFRLYSYKVDKHLKDANGDPVVLPKLEDKNNHAIDALRYAHERMMKRSGSLGVWAKLAGVSR